MGIWLGLWASASGGATQSASMLINLYLTLGASGFGKHASNSPTTPPPTLELKKAHPRSGTRRVAPPPPGSPIAAW